MILIESGSIGECRADGARSGKVEVGHYFVYTQPACGRFHPRVRRGTACVVLIDIFQSTGDRLEVWKKSLESSNLVRISFNRSCFVYPG